MVALYLSIVALAAAESPGNPTVLVTGATGRTGALLYSWLKAKNIPVRAFVRNATKARIQVCWLDRRALGFFFMRKTGSASGGSVAQL